MDLVINLSDGIFSAFQTSWRKILGSFLQNYVFFRLLLLSTRLTSFAENHDSLQRRPLCTLMKPLLLDYAKFMVKIYMFFYGCLHYLCAYNVGIIIFLICQMKSYYLDISYSKEGPAGTYSTSTASIPLRQKICLLLISFVIIAIVIDLPKVIFFAAQKSSLLFLSLLKTIKFC